MSEARVGSLVVELRANATQFFGEVRKVNQGLTSLNSSIGTVGNAFRALAGAAAAGMFGRLALDVIESAGNLQDFSDRLKISAELLQELGFAAKQYGVDQEQVNSAIERMGKTSSEAARGVGRAKDDYKLLGIEAKKFLELPWDQKLKVLAERITKTGNVSDQTAHMIKIMGDAALLPLFQQGAEGLDKFIQSAITANAVMSNQTTASLEAVGDAFGDMTKAIRTAIGEGLAPLTPQLTGLATDIRDKLPRSLMLAADAFHIVGQTAKLAFATLVGALGVAKLALGGFGQAVNITLINPILAFVEVLARVSATGIANPFANFFTGIADSAARLRGVSESMKAMESGALDLKTATMIAGEAAESLATGLPSTQAAFMGVADGAKAVTAETGMTAAALGAINPALAGTVQSAEALAAAHKRLAEMTRFLGEELGDMKAAIGGSSDLFEGWRAQVLRLADDVRAGRITWDLYAEGLKQVGDAYEDALGNRARQFIQEGMTWQDKWLQQQREALELLNAQKLSWDEYAKFIQVKGAEAAAAFRQQQKDADSLANDITDSMRGWTSEAGDAIVEFAARGKLAVSDLVDSILKDLARILIQRSVTDPLAAGLSSAIGGLFSGGGAGAPSENYDWTSAYGATGGTWRVAGAGGVDSKRVTLGVTPGELVKVIPQSEQDGLRTVAGAVGETESRLTGALVAAMGPLLTALRPTLIVMPALAGGTAARATPASAGRLPGFASGGSFEVGGAGGTDSKLVAFRATPGELVKVTHGDERGGMGRLTVNFTVNAVDAAGIDSLLVKRRDMFVSMVQDAFDKRGLRGLR